MLRFLERLIYPLALLAGAIGLAYWYWTTTPSYAVNAVVDSLRHHDVDTFQKYVDIDSVASHAFDDVVDGPAVDKLVGHRDNFIGMGFIRFFKRDIVGIAHERLCGLISDPNVDLENATAGTMEAMHKYKISPKVRQALVAYGLTKEGFRGVKYLEVNGGIAALGLDFYSPMLRNHYIVAFRLEDAGGYWRVTEVTNLNDLLSIYLQTRSRLPV
jgi:hypothetical protein